jgi:hypothetical protein
VKYLMNAGRQTANARCTTNPNLSSIYHSQLQLDISPS